VRFQNAALTAGFVAVLGLAVLLVFQLGRSPDVAIAEEDLAAARARYQRQQAARTAPTPPDFEARTQAPPRARPPTPAPAPAPAPPTVPTRSDRAPPSLPAPAVPPEQAARSEIDDIRSAFDRGEFFEALEAAEAHLGRNPNQEYVRRVAVTSACAVGRDDVARKYFEQMNDRDQRTARVRCGRYGIDL
jgi:hypothetical protein